MEKELRQEQEKLATKLIKNKDQVLTQIEANKRKAKDERWRNLQDERKMIQEVVLDVNAKVATVKEQVLGDLTDTKALTNARVIKRIGK